MAAAGVLSACRSSVAAILVLSMCGSPSAQGQERLPVPGGAYRGTVVDDRTSQPVPDAVVVMLWQREDDQIPGMMRLAAAAEAFTDAKGQFLLDVVALEPHLPRGTFAPRVLIFRPGYGPFPRTPQRTPPGAPASEFSAAGAVVRLVPVTDYEDRSEALNTFVAMLSAAHAFPGPELRKTSELIRFELATLGVRPPPPVSPRGER
jgi:hypothetical protein